MVARASEVVRLRAGDIDSEHMIIRIVQWKGRKDRYVMLPPEVLKLLRQWWKVRPTTYNNGVAPEHRWLFPGRSQHQPLTTRQFSRLFKEAAKAAGPVPLGQREIPDWRGPSWWPTQPVSPSEPLSPLR
jgi:integrase